MKSSLFVCLLILFVASTSGRLLRDFQLNLNLTGAPIWFNEQRLDHFSPQDQRTWAQRYWVLDEVYRQGGPVFLYICGEATCRGAPGATSFPYVLAKKFGALILALEHRYYGESQPFGKESMKTVNLAYLTVENALEDLAYFIKWFKANNHYGVGDDSKWITIGGSYPGALSAWFRAKYPHLTVGAWASSGVVHSIVDFDLYDYQVFLSTSNSGPECPRTIQNFTHYVEEKLETDPKFRDKFGPDVQYLRNDDVLSFIADCWAGRIQYGTREDLCNELASHKTWDDLVDGTIKNCLKQSGLKNYSPKFVANETLTEDNDDDLGRQWLYQTCTQMGWFQTVQNNSAFATRSKRINLDYYKSFCRDVFGRDFWPDEEQFNWRYGSDHLRATNIAHVASSEDPWTWASKNFTEGSMTSLYVNCGRCGHCSDLRAADISDSSREVHKKIDALITQYLGLTEEETVQITK